MIRSSIMNIFSRVERTKGRRRDRRKVGNDLNQIKLLKMFVQGSSSPSSSSWLTQFHRVFSYNFINFLMIIVCPLYYQAMNWIRNLRRKNSNEILSSIVQVSFFALSSSSGDHSFEYSFICYLTLPGYQQKKTKIFWRKNSSFGLKINRFLSFKSCAARCC